MKRIFTITFIVLVISLIGFKNENQPSLYAGDDGYPIEQTITNQG